jgi:hypothetical protein
MSVCKGLLDELGNCLNQDEQDERMNRIWVWKNLANPKIKKILIQTSYLLLTTFRPFFDATSNMKHTCLKRLEIRDF